MVAPTMATRRPAQDALPAAARITHSVVVPAYKEGRNLHPLVTRVFAALAAPQSPVEARHVEVIIVDDNSRDGSVEAVEALRGEGYNVRMIVRTAERGLSSAVIRGFRDALGESMLCMDADLQHPPESVPALLGMLSERQPFVIATRYGAGVQMDENWPMHRRIISTGARLLSRPLTGVSDPMTGFFGIRKKTFLQAGSVNPHGFKIALDLLVKARIPASSVCEYPFSFGVRTEGESKLDSKVMVRYLEQLAELYYFRFGPLVYVFLLFTVLAVLFITFLAAQKLWT